MKFLMAAVIAFVSVSAFAQTKIVSVDAFDIAYTGGLAFTHYDSKKGSNRNDTTFKLNLNYAQNIENYAGLMWKTAVQLNRHNMDYGSNDLFESSYGVSGGILYNFQSEDIKNSFMAGTMLGVERATYKYNGGDDQSGYNLWVNFEGGKRFDLGKYSVANISYAPTVSLSFKRYGGDIRDDYFKSGTDLRFNFLKFDILF